MKENTVLYLKTTWRKCLFWLFPSLTVAIAAFVSAHFLKGSSGLLKSDLLPICIILGLIAVLVVIIAFIKLFERPFVILDDTSIKVVGEKEILLADITEMVLEKSPRALLIKTPTAAVRVPAKRISLAPETLKYAIELRLEPAEK